MPIYTRAQLKTRINAGIKGKIGMLISSEDTINQAAREVVNDADLSSTKRRSMLSPNLFKDIDPYTCPTDLKADKAISIKSQIGAAQEFNLVPFEEYWVRQESNIFTFDERDDIKKILIRGKIDDDTLVISTLDSLTAGGGTWQSVGDATNVSADGDDYVKGSSSIVFDIGSGATTTAGIQNISLNQSDITNYRNHSAFIWHKIISTTDITSYTLRIGSDSSNYIYKTVTSQADGTAFVVGWNLLAFDLSTATTVGTPVVTAYDYASIFMTKSTGKVNETGYRFDHLILKKGKIHELYYYSKYPWQSSAGTWKENSTSDTDYLNAGSEEYNLFVMKGIELAAREVEEYVIASEMERKYKERLDAYMSDNPSEEKTMTTEYYRF